MTRVYGLVETLIVSHDKKNFALSDKGRYVLRAEPGRDKRNLTVVVVLDDEPYQTSTDSRSADWDTPNYGVLRGTQAVELPQQADIDEMLGDLRERRDETRRHIHPYLDGEPSARTLRAVEHPYYWGDIRPRLDNLITT